MKNNKNYLQGLFIVTLLVSSLSATASEHIYQKDISQKEITPQVEKCLAGVLDSNKNQTSDTYVANVWGGRF